MGQAEVVALRAFCSRKELGPPVSAAETYLTVGPSRFRNGCHFCLLLRRLFCPRALQNQGHRAIVDEAHFHMGPENPGFDGQAFLAQGLHEKLV